jgi:hypothetical protein
MDNKLLNALNNIGDALDALVEALNDKASAKSDAGAALQSGDFGKQLESISKDIKSIKADTQEILKQQKTILSQAKAKEADSKLGIMDSLGGDDSMMKNIAKGIGVIMLLAVAVLAIGMAFKLVGKVDILSVIGLALGITIISIAFAKIAELKIGLKEAAIASGVMVITSLGLMLSSMLLNQISPVSPAKILTAIAISAGFALLGPSIGKLITSFKGMGFMDLLKTFIFLPIILPAISWSIALSSEYLQRVQPIGLSQFISSILISGIFVVLAFGLKKMIGAFKGVDPISIAIGAIFLPIILIAIAKTISEASEVLSGVKMISLGSFFGAILVSAIFVVLSYSVKNMINAFKGIDPVVAVIAAFFLPNILVSISKAIADSSEILSGVKMMSLGAFFGAILVSAIFVVISFGIKRMINAFKGIDPATAIIASITIPILMVAISGAIWASSHILDKMVIVDENKLINAGLIGAGLAILSIAMAPTIKILSKIGIGEIIKGALIIPILAAAVMISSLILDLGTYENYPGLGWVAGVSLSLLTFGLGALALGSAVFGPQALIFAAGLGAILVVAGTIVGVSHILKAGKYDNPGMLEWAAAVSLLYLTFTPIMLILGTAALAAAVVSLFGPDPWKMAQTAIEDVARTIVSASVILSEGYTDKDGNKIKPNYKGGPTKEWAEGVSIALGAFSPVYGMLMKNAVLKIFGSGGVGPEEFTEAIQTVSKGIVTAANFFALPENKGVWGAHPTKEWSEGVGLAIGAFAPVFEVLTNQSWLSKSVSAKDMKKAILTISEGIIEAAKFFAENTAPFKEGNYPSVEWGEGVGAALGAFAPVFEALQGKSWYKSDKKVVDGMVNGILSVSSAIVQVALKFSVFSSKKIFEFYPSDKWGMGVKSNVEIFTRLSKYIKDQDSNYSNIQNVTNRLVKVAKTLHSNSDLFSVEIDPNYIKNVSQNIMDFTELVKKISESEDSTFFSRLGDSLTGGDPIVIIAKRMMTLADGYDKLANSLIKLGTAMRVLNISDASKLGGITKNIIKGEEAKDISKSFSPSTPTIKTGDTSLFENFLKGDKNKDKEKETSKSMSEKMDQVITLLTSINTNTVNINKFIEDATDGAIEAPPELG